MDDHNDRETRGDERRPRRPYSPPSIVESATFETLALACTQVTPDVDECNPEFGGFPGAS